MKSGSLLLSLAFMFSDTVSYVGNAVLLCSWNSGNHLRYSHETFMQLPSSFPILTLDCKAEIATSSLLRVWRAHRDWGETFRHGMPGRVCKWTRHAGTTKWTHPAEFMRPSETQTGQTGLPPTVHRSARMENIWHVNSTGATSGVGAGSVTNYSLTQPNKSTCFGTRTVCFRRTWCQKQRV